MAIKIQGALNVCESLDKLGRGFLYPHIQAESVGIRVLHVPLASRFWINPQNIPKWESCRKQTFPSFVFADFVLSVILAAFCLLPCLALIWSPLFLPELQRKSH